MTPRQVTAALFVVALSMVVGLIGWEIGSIVGLVGGFAVGIVVADWITRVLERIPV